MGIIVVKLNNFIVGLERLLVRPLAATVEVLIDLGVQTFQI